TLGQWEQGQRVVKKGLKAEDRVVTGGQESTHLGMKVRPRPAPEQEKEEGKQEDRKPGGGNRPLSLSPSGAGSGIFVEAAYLGAAAEEVSASVRAPIEQQLRGLENLRQMRSRCTANGEYALALSFTRGADLRMRQVL